MRRTLLLMLCLTIATCALAQSDRGPSTAEERARAVQIAHNLEANPLDPNLRSDAAWLLKWAADVPDIHVNICASNAELKQKYKYSPQLEFQKLASATAFEIEHPDQANDSHAQELAAVEGALKAYQSILTLNPKAHSAYWDSLLEKQSAGTLKDFVAKYVSDECSAGTKA